MAWDARKLGVLVRTVALLTLERTLEKLRAPFYPALQIHLNLAPRTLFSLDVQWMSDDQIQELNSDYRGKNRATDVLSFPFWEGEMPEWDQEIVPLGDLIFSLETAQRQAQELKHDLGAEIAFLTIHGVLHLLGFDHDTPARRKAMFSWQDEIFAAWEAR